MTAVLAVLLVLGAVVLCAVTWRTRGHERPGVPDREMGALTAWDPAELREWTLELHHTKNTPPWPPLPHPDAAAGSQGGGHDWLAAPTLPSQEPVAPWRGRRADHQEADGNLAGDPVTHDLWQPRPADEWTTELIPAVDVPAAQDWAVTLPPMSPQLAQGLRDAEDAQRWPDLQHGYGYADSTGTFTRIVGDGAA